MPRFSANLGFLWPDRPLLARIDAAAAAGFRAIELHWPYDVPPEEVRDACARHDLTLLGLNSPVGREPGDFGLAAVPGRVAEFREGFAQAADYARRAGASAVHVMAGKPAMKVEGGLVFAENLAWAAAAAPDMTLLLEPINRIDQPAYFYSMPEEAAVLIDQVGAPNIGCMFDAYHVGIGGADVIESLETHLPRIRHAQIAAVPSRAEPDEGELSYGPVFEALDRLGYTGWVGCEYRPRGSTDEGLRWCAALGVSL